MLALKTNLETDRPVSGDLEAARLNFPCVEPRPHPAHSLTK